MASHVETASKRAREILSMSPRSRKAARVDPPEPERKVEDVNLMPGLSELFPVNKLLLSRYQYESLKYSNPKDVWPAFQAELDKVIDITTRKWCAIYALSQWRESKLPTEVKSPPVVDLSVDASPILERIAEVKKELEDSIDDSESEPDSSDPSYSPSEEEDEDEVEEMVYCPPTSTRQLAKGLERRPILMRRAKNG